MTEGRGRVFSKGLSLQLQEGFGGLLASAGQALGLTYLLCWPEDGGAVSLGWGQRAGPRGQPCGVDGVPEGRQQVTGCREGGAGHTGQAWPDGNASPHPASFSWGRGFHKDRRGPDPVPSSWRRAG